jgi:(S)-mandelate dehydrogenase
MPSRLRDVSKRDLGIELFGQHLEHPFLIGPTGLNGVFWPKGDLLLARAAARAGVPFTLSTPAQSTIEEVAAGSGNSNLWFQLYVVERGLAERLVARALNAGFTTLVLTTDVPVNGLRERDARNGWELPFKYRPQILLDGALHPQWSVQFLRGGMPQLANFTSEGADTEAQYAVMHRQMDASFNWEDLSWLRQLWPHTLLVKGILTPEDAALAAERGADGVIVSNHGGRQQDDLPPTAEVLASVIAATDKPVLVDSGFRRGSDIVKALALGASAVLLGRATLYGLAARGQTGAEEVLALLGNELDTTLALIGAPSVRALDRTYVHAPPEAPETSKSA